MSSRSVLARRCSRDTATLDAWMIWASMSRALSQRASQKPSRPASKATAMRLIRSSRLRRLLSPSMQQLQQCALVRPRASSMAAGARRRGTRASDEPAADRLNSITAISVPSGSRGFRDRLRSLNFCIGRSIGSATSNDGCNIPRRRPIASSLGGFAYAGPRARGATVMGPQSANLHSNGSGPNLLGHGHCSSVTVR